MQARDSAAKQMHTEIGNCLRCALSAKLQVQSDHHEGNKSLVLHNVWHASCSVMQNLMVRLVTDMLDYDVCRLAMFANFGFFVQVSILL